MEDLPGQLFFVMMKLIIQKINTSMKVKTGQTTKVISDSALNIKLVVRSGGLP